MAIQLGKRTNARDGTRLGGNGPISAVQKVRQRRRSDIRNHRERLTVEELRGAAFV